MQAQMPVSLERAHSAHVATRCSASASSPGVVRIGCSARRLTPNQRLANRGEVHPPQGVPERLDVPPELLRQRLVVSGADPCRDAEVE